MQRNTNLTIRKAERKDVGLLLEFIRGIAKYEKMENEVVATAEMLEAEMFDHHRAEAVFAVVDGKEVGFALYFFNFSTFIGHSGLYLEDLFVWPEYRGRGYGKTLLLHLAAMARDLNLPSHRTQVPDLPSEAVSGALCFGDGRCRGQGGGWDVSGNLRFASAVRPEAGCRLW